VVKPGEVLYVPDFWNHATCNLDTINLGVGGQVGSLLSSCLRPRLCACCDALDSEG
jgi:hypothetical protein